VAVLEAGRVDILVNNAATVEPLGPTIAIPAGELRLAFEVNVVAPVALAAAVLPGMLDARCGRVVNISSAIAAYPAGMVRGNATPPPGPPSRPTPSTLPPNSAAPTSPSTPTGRAVSTRHADLDPRPGSRRIGAGLHERFNKNFADGVLITPEHSAAALLAHLAGDDTGAIWDVSIAPVRT